MRNNKIIEKWFCKAFTVIFLIYKKANNREEISKNNFIALFYSRLMPGIQTAKALGT